MPQLTVPEAFTLAMDHHQAGRFTDAVALYRQIVSEAPQYVEAHYNLGIALKASGQLDEAIASYQRATSLRPQFAQAYLNLGNALRENGQWDDAIDAYRAAVAARPDYAEAHHNLAVSLHELGEIAEAIKCFHRALELSPNMGEAWQNLGNALRDSGKVDEAIEAHHKAMTLMPNSSAVFVGVGNALRDAGRVREAIEAYRQAQALAESESMPLKARCTMFSNLLYTSYFDPKQDRKSIYVEHARWQEQLVRPHLQSTGEHPNDRSASRRLRVAYVSPDFSQNPVGRFMLPLLANHDHHELEVVCYSDIRRPDAMTERLRACSDVWRQTDRLTDEQLTTLILSNAVDILVDLSLHTRGNRLLVFARKPAPVQVSYLAYCGTTGLRAIDYRLTDRFMDPPDRGDEFYSEQSVRLPNCFWCYQPLQEHLPVNDPPVLRNGFITFGCLNNYSKVNDFILNQWCQLLKKVPDSRLLLFAEPGQHRQRAWKKLEHEGIDPRRLAFTGFQPPEQYLRQYHHIDVALDPYPYGGGTTTFDALWMGVPVVSLSGDTAVSRAGLSILSNLGLAELAASNPHDYLSIAADLATDSSRLANLRSNLRNRLQTSPLMDARRFAKDVEAAFRHMWMTWTAAS